MFPCSCQMYARLCQIQSRLCKMLPRANKTSFLTIQKHPFLCMTILRIHQKILRSFFVAFFLQIKSSALVSFTFYPSPCTNSILLHQTINCFSQFIYARIPINNKVCSIEQIKTRDFFYIVGLCRLRIYISES